jgi:hypothetical protein
MGWVCFLFYFTILFLEGRASDRWHAHIYKILYRLHLCLFVKAWVVACLIGLRSGRTCGAEYGDA